MSGQKSDSGKPDYTWIPMSALDGVTRVMSFGAKKYSRDNWKQVADGVHRYIAAAMRHLASLNEGESIDPESGELHIDHALTSLIFARWLLKENQNEARNNVDSGDDNCGLASATDWYTRCVSTARGIDLEINGNGSGTDMRERGGLASDSGLRRNLKRAPKSQRKNRAKPTTNDAGLRGERVQPPSDGRSKVAAVAKHKRDKTKRLAVNRRVGTKAATMVGVDRAFR